MIRWTKIKILFKEIGGNDDKPEEENNKDASNDQRNAQQSGNTWEIKLDEFHDENSIKLLAEYNLMLMSLPSVNCWLFENMVTITTQS